MESLQRKTPDKQTYFVNFWKGKQKKSLKTESHARKIGKERKKDTEDDKNGRK